MTLQTSTICRGDGKGYVRIDSDERMGKITAIAKSANGTVIPCPVYRLGFPGEDAGARQNLGERPGQESCVVAVPLLDNTTLTIHVFGETSAEPLLDIPFQPFATKIKSRLTYRRHPEQAYQIRGIDQRRLSGQTYVYVAGIYPIDAETVSCRFHVRFPAESETERCSIDIYDAAANRVGAKLEILEDSLISDPHDSNRHVHEIVYAALLSRTPQTICIVAKPESHNANFTCILPDVFSGFLTAAMDFTKHVMNDDGYGQWFEQHRATFEDVENQRQICAQWEDAPLISIVTVVFRPPIEYLQALIESLKIQSYEHFEVIFVNVSGTDPEVDRVIAGINDERFTVIRAENKSIAENTNIGIRAARGKYVAFIDHDDVIEPDTLYRYMTVIRSNSRSDVLYCDEDVLDNGTYCRPTFKPAYNADLLLSCNYITHMLMVSRHVLEQVELSPADVSGAQDYDLTLKCVEQAREIHNVPFILYHWRMHQASTSADPGSKPYAQEAGRLALTRHYERAGIPAEVQDTDLAFRYRTVYRMDKQPKVSIVIPTKDHVDVLHQCLEAVLSNTTYRNYNVILVENNSVEDRTFDYYRMVQERYENVSVVTWPGTGFNYSAICNYGATRSDGELILFLNNDTEVIAPQWLESMVGFFARPEVGIVGAKLLYRDGLVQHGGVWASMDHCGHFGELLSKNDGGYMEMLRYSTDCAAVTGACQLIRRDLFEKIGGLDESLAVVLNDVDLCLKAGQEGYLVVFDPQAVLYHNEHTSRGRDEQDVNKELRAINEQATFYAKWNRFLTRGQFINNNLNQYDGHFKLRW